MLTAERLKQVLTYNPVTGWFWRGDTLAGSLNLAGYRQIRVDGKLYLAHRLAWLYVHGEWPADEIDHINGDRADNRFANLRPVTSGQNKMNSAKRSDNTSGVKGVSLRADTGKWFAYINAGPGTRRVGLGCYDTLAEAAEARRYAEAKMHGDFARSY